MLLNLLFSAVIGYLCGSVPFGYLIGKFNGIDIRRHGSCNIGATNVTRVLGKGWGRFCFLLDFGKGFGPVLAVAVFMRHHPNLEGSGLCAILTAAATVCGHMWPVFLDFAGGKGVATSIGALLALSPVPILAAVIVWAVVFYSSRYVSLASICAAAMMPINAVIFNITGQDWCRTSNAAIILLVVVAALIIIRHKGNIERLRNGTENRFTKKQKER